IRTDEALPPIGRALEEAHYPSTFEDRDAALKRLAFDELLALQVGMVGRRRQRGISAARAVPITHDVDRELRAAIVAALRRRVGPDVQLTADEQHRFGVEQRGQLEAKAAGHAPHVLLMTATPIPRTLGQVLYADLDVSDLRTPPQGRIAIRTGIRRPVDLDATWAHVRAEAMAGHRTFVVVPLIEEGDDPDGTVAAESEAVRLRQLL